MRPLGKVLRGGTFLVAHPPIMPRRSGLVGRRVLTCRGYHRAMTRAEELFAQARAVIPGGVDSPVRGFGSVGGTPVFAARGDGAYVESTDGTRYVDLVQSWGALLFGHAHPAIVQAATAAAARGTSFGMPTEGETELARRIVDAVASVEQVRLVSSGTEAAMSAIRLARGATGRDLIVKFDGCYHGHSDALLAKGAGSGLATLGIPSSPGVTEGAAKDTLTAPFNDADAVRALFAEHGDAIAAVIVEPVAANMGVVPPADGFLEALRATCIEHGALLIFDEVITGFRIAYAGAQQVYDIAPDLTVFGKVMGGGFPCAAFGGRRDVMANLAPDGPVYQAGTLSGNPVAVAAGIAALDLARETDPYPQLEQAAIALSDGLAERFAARGIPATINRARSLFSVFFADGPVRTFEEAKAADHRRYARFFHHMLANGVALPPSGYELWTLGAAHGGAELDAILRAAETFEG
jgi:glutamate-1-semialdehyde 2,1-aminomutase